MARLVHFDVSAEAEAHAAAAWYEAQSSGYRQRFVSALADVIDRIAEVPGSSSIVPGVDAKRPLRRAPVKGFPFWVVFLESPSNIYVVAVAHMHRAPQYWRSRVP